VRIEQFQCGRQYPGLCFFRPHAAASLPYLTELLIRLNGLRLQLQGLSDGTQWLGRSFGPAMQIENYKTGIESPRALAPPEQADAAQ
jgi:hypothetical protein